MSIEVNEGVGADTNRNSGTAEAFPIGEIGCAAAYYLSKGQRKEAEMLKRLFLELFNRREGGFYFIHDAELLNLLMQAQCDRKVHPICCATPTSPTLPSWCGKDAIIPKDLAARFIEASAWWLTHSSGSPVRARRHADRIYNSTEHGWAIDFGANSFLVGKAIQGCGLELEKVYHDLTAGKTQRLEYIRFALGRIIGCAVANFGGAEYGSYPIRDEMLRFGAQAISVRDGADFLIEESGSRRLLMATTLWTPSDLCAQRKDGIGHVSQENMQVFSQMYPAVSDDPRHAEGLSVKQLSYRASVITAIRMRNVHGLRDVGRRLGLSESKCEEVERRHLGTVLHCGPPFRTRGAVAVRTDAKDDAPEIGESDGRDMEGIPNDGDYIDRLSSKQLIYRASVITAARMRNTHGLRDVGRRLGLLDGECQEVERRYLGEVLQSPAQSGTSEPSAAQVDPIDNVLNLHDYRLRMDQRSD